MATITSGVVVSELLGVFKDAGASEVFEFGVLKAQAGIGWIESK